MKVSMEKKSTAKKKSHGKKKQNKIKSGTPKTTASTPK
jgi:hypothetical protein